MSIVKKIISLLLLLTLPTLVATTYAAQDKSQITWNQSASATVSAIGIGLPPESAHTAAQAKALARRAAIIDAYRNLLEATENINVDADTTIKNLMIANDTVRTHVDGIIHGAKIIDEQYMSDGSYQITLEINLFGENSLASVAIEKAKPNATQPISEPNQNDISSGTLKQPYSFMPTGIIIDARNLGLEATFSPGIYDQNGKSIYGSQNIDPDYAIKYGMVDYAPTPELIQAAENGQSRAGSSPIIVKAVALKNNNQSVIISQSDAEKILSANQIAKFLDKYAVVFFQ